MMKKLTRLPKAAIAATALLAIAQGAAVFANADQGSAMGRQATGADWGPKWTADGKLKIPEGYHEWVFLGSPLTPNALNGGEAGFPEYHNVYVQPQAFHAYKKTGKWPEGTIMFKELQRVRSSMTADGSSVEVSGRGYFPGALNGVDISVKDRTRFSDTNDWGFFTFGHTAPPYSETAAEMPVEACASCHIENATNMVFKKFYDPILESGQ